jgi:hypothetical protein
LTSAAGLIHRTGSGGSALSRTGARPRGVVVPDDETAREFDKASVAFINCVREFVVGKDAVERGVEAASGEVARRLGGAARFARVSKSGLLMELPARSTAASSVATGAVDNGSVFVGFPLIMLTLDKVLIGIKLYCWSNDYATKFTSGSINRVVCVCVY